MILVRRCPNRSPALWMTSALVLLTDRGRRCCVSVDWAAVVDPSRYLFFVLFFFPFFFPLPSRSSIKQHSLAQLQNSLTFSTRARALRPSWIALLRARDTLALPLLTLNQIRSDQEEYFALRPGSTARTLETRTATEARERARGRRGISKREGMFGLQNPSSPEPSAQNRHAQPSGVDCRASRKRSLTHGSFSSPPPLPPPSFDSPPSPSTPTLSSPSFFAITLIIVLSRGVRRRRRVRAPRWDRKINYTPNKQKMKIIGLASTRNKGDFFLFDISRHTYRATPRCPR